MSDVIYTESESDVIIEPGPDTVTLITTEAEPSVIIIQPDPDPAGQIIIVDEETSSEIVTESPAEIDIMEVITEGPQGIPGLGIVLNGSITGDIIRWNADTEAWEVKSEPLSFTQIILTPALASIIDTEGSIYYNSTQKAVLVCTDIL
jgi:folate-dependent tRNA-U54 methylase TrmFO/GidA